MFSSVIKCILVTRGLRFKNHLFNCIIHVRGQSVDWLTTVLQPSWFLWVSWVPWKIVKDLQLFADYSIRGPPLPFFISIESSRNLSTRFFIWTLFWTKRTLLVRSFCASARMPSSVMFKTLSEHPWRRTKADVGTTIWLFDTIIDLF